MMQDTLENKDTATVECPPEPRAGAAVAAYVNRVAMRLAVRLWWVLLPAFACITWGLMSDWRIAVIGLMLLFLVFPFIMTMAIMNHAMRPELVALTRAAELIVDYDALTLVGDEGEIIKTLARSQIRSVASYGSSLEICFGKRVSDIMLINRQYLGEERARQIINEFAPEEVLN